MQYGLYYVGLLSKVSTLSRFRLLLDTKRFGSNVDSDREAREPVASSWLSPVSRDCAIVGGAPVEVGAGGVASLTGVIPDKLAAEAVLTSVIAGDASKMAWSA